MVMTLPVQFSKEVEGFRYFMTAVSTAVSR